jgi:hypothetical protein
VIAEDRAERSRRKIALANPRLGYPPDLNVHVSMLRLAGRTSIGENCAGCRSAMGKFISASVSVPLAAM